MTARLDDRGLPTDYPFKDEWEITPREAKRRLEGEEGFVLLDVRLDDELRAASVPGATHIPLHELALRIDELGEDDERPIATLCHHGRRSMQATTLLRQYGFDNARSVAGGIDLWSISADPSVGRYERVAGECRPVSGGS